MRDEGLMENLKGVHPHLEALTRRAIEIAPYEIAVAVGKRSQVEQNMLFIQNRVSSKDSRHVPMPGGNGFSHAVELDIISDNPDYGQLNLAFRKASQELEIPYDWGGNRKTNKEEGYFQLPTRGYPLDGPVRPLPSKPSPTPSEPPEMPVWGEIDTAIGELSDKEDEEFEGNTDLEDKENHESTDDKW